MYKELLSESYNETSYYKAIIDKIETMAKDYPNDMQLGKRIRSLCWALKDERDLANDKI